MTSTMKTKTTSPQPQSFESSLSELEGIIARMEAGQMPLQESLTAYKRGALLLRECQETLAAAEQQVRILQDGNLRPFEPEISDKQKD